MARKSAQISVNVTEEQKARWQAEAAKRDKTLPEFIRHCVDTYIALMQKVPQKNSRNDAKM